MRIPQTEDSTITVSSTAFQDGQPIPRDYTCAGAGISAPLQWSGVPADADNLALVVSDPDAPRGTFLHWLVYGIAASDASVPAGTTPAGGSEGRNSGDRVGWYPPCPPSGTHRYVLTIYALDAPLTGTSSQGLLDAIEQHTIASGSLMGTVTAG